jgi:hypothetical protein
VTFEPASRATKAPRRPAGSGRAPRQPRAALPSLRKELDTFVVSINELLHAFDPLDALDDKEVAALVDALDKESRKSARLHRGLQTLLTFGSGGGLGMVVGIIVGRRLARRQLLGPTLSPVVDQVGGVIISGVQAEPSEAAEAMGMIRDMMSGAPRATDGITPAG